MSWQWLARLLERLRPSGNGAAVAQAQRAREAAERKRLAAERLWPKTEEARDRLAELIENALRGNR